jgi:hypothetical protein
MARLDARSTSDDSQAKQLAKLAQSEYQTPVRKMLAAL